MAKLPLDFGSPDAIEYLEMASLALYAHGMDTLHATSAVVAEARALAKHGECVLRDTDDELVILITAMDDVFECVGEDMVRLR